MPHPPEPLKRLEEKLHRISHGRGDLDDARGNILFSLLAQHSTVSRFCVPDTRARVSFGRPAARRCDSGIVVGVGKSQLTGVLEDPIPTSTRACPRWDTESEIRLTEYTHRDPCADDSPDSPITELDVLDIDAADPPFWSTSEHVAADWTRALRRIFDPDDPTLIDHTTTLCTLAAVRMILDSEYGYVDLDPPLGRDGRVALRDEYAGVPTVTIFTPDAQLAFDMDTLRDMIRQRGVYTTDGYLPTPDVDPPGNQFFEAD